MYDLLAAINFALMPMSAFYFWYFLKYRYDSRQEPQLTPLAIFGWSILCFSVGMFISSLLYFLWDYDVIYKSTQYKLSVIPRATFVAGLGLGFHALNMRWKKTIMAVALSLAVGVLVVRILW